MIATAAIRRCDSGLPTTFRQPGITDVGLRIDVNGVVVTHTINANLDIQWRGEHYSYLTPNEKPKGFSRAKARSENSTFTIAAGSDKK